MALPGVETRIVDNSIREENYFENSCLFVGRFLTDFPVNTPMRITSKQDFEDVFGDINEIITTGMLDNGLDVSQIPKELQMNSTEYINYIKENYYEEGDILENYINPFRKNLSKDEIFEILEDYFQVLNFIEYGRPLGLIVIRYEDNPLEAFNSLETLESNWIEMIMATKRTYQSAVLFAKKENIPVVYSIPAPLNPSEFVIRSKYLAEDTSYIIVGDRRVSFKGRSFLISCVGDIVGFRHFLINNINLTESHCKINYVFRQSFNVPKFSKEQKEILYGNKINFLEYNNLKVKVSSEKIGLKNQNLTNILIVNRIRRKIQSSLNESVFKLNNYTSRWGAKNKIQNFLSQCKDFRFITDYSIICDETNNKDGANTIYCDVYIKMTNLTEFIKLNFHLNPIDFN